MLPWSSVASGATPTTVSAVAFSSTERPVTPPVNRGLGNTGAMLFRLFGAVTNSEVAARVFVVAPCPSL